MELFPFLFLILKEFLRTFKWVIIIHFRIFTGTCWKHSRYLTKNLPVRRYMSGSHSKCKIFTIRCKFTIPPLYTLGAATAWIYYLFLALFGFPFRFVEKKLTASSPEGFLTDVSKEFFCPKVASLTRANLRQLVKVAQFIFSIIIFWHQDITSAKGQL